ncbi:zf-HC2 domain-containing protein [Telmatobacter sp. DSM 110680]|uniref:Zf-HC2 domain-containing protein n=1 Tax=Telmatobacter sp. DSM 110680 TaxID=3036704 RepID=A0AAU7DLC6_9BACT
MMPCDQDREMLAAYLDGEVQAEEGNALERHLSTCSTCTAEVASMLSVRRTMRTARTRFTPSVEFRRKIQSQTAPRKPGFKAFGGLSLAIAALAMLVFVMFWMRQGAVRADAYREVADLHVGDLASANPYDVVSSDRHTVKPWFQGRIPFSFNLPEFAGTEFTLLGGRLVYLHQQPSAQVVVGMGQHKISVLIMQDDGVFGSAFPVSERADARNAFNIETWNSQGLRFFVIGDAEKTGVRHLAQILQNANQ